MSVNPPSVLGETLKKAVDFYLYSAPFFLAAHLFLFVILLIFAILSWRSAVKEFIWLRRLSNLPYRGGQETRAMILLNSISFSAAQNPVILSGMQDEFNAYLRRYDSIFGGLINGFILVGLAGTLFNLFGAWTSEKPDLTTIIPLLGSALTVSFFGLAWAFLTSMVLVLPLRGLLQDCSLRFSERVRLSVAGATVQPIKQTFEEPFREMLARTEHAHVKAIGELAAESTKLVGAIEKLGESVGQTVSQTQKMQEEFGKVAPDILGKLSAFSKAWEEQFEKTKQVMHGYGQSWQAVTNSAVEQMSALSVGLHKAVAEFSSVIELMKQQTTVMGQAFDDQLKRTHRAVANELEQFAEKAGSTLETFLSPLNDLLGSIRASSNQIQTSSEEFAALLGLIEAAQKEQQGEWSKQLRELQDRLKNWGEETAKHLSSSLDESFNSSFNTFEEAFEKLQEEWKREHEQSVTAFKNASKALVGATADMGQAITRIGAAANQVAGPMEKLSTGLENIAFLAELRASVDRFDATLKLVPEQLGKVEVALDQFKTGIAGWDELILVLSAELSSLRKSMSPVSTIMISGMRRSA